jgi:hypothetical protein
LLSLLFITFYFTSLRFTFYNMTKCSFCKQTGHNINACKHESKDIALEKFALCYSLATTTTQLQQQLLKFSLNDIKIISITLCGSRATLSKAEHIVIISDKFNIPDNEEPQHIEQTPPPAPAELQPGRITRSHTRRMRMQQTTPHIPRPPTPPRTRHDNTQTHTQTHTHSDYKVSTLEECSVCFDTDVHKDNVILLQCKHQFCTDCIIHTIQSTALRNSCPLCRASITQLYVSNSGISRNKLLQSGVIRAH